LVRGGAGTSYIVAERHHDTLIEKAVVFMMNEAPSHVRRVPDTETLRALMVVVNGGETLADEEFGVRKYIPAFEPFPWGAKWRNGPAKIPDDFLVAIVGTGFSGIGMAVQLEMLGIPYVVFERRHELGGVWSINTYPDARVDTPSAMYTFSFEKAFPWTEYFAKQPEVRAYLEHVARKFQVYEHIRFHHEVKGGAYEESSSTWSLDVVDQTGRHKKVRANFVINATGLFASPKELDVDGVQAFKGELVHSTEWSKHHTAVGKSVAIIGNGSTGVQLLQAVANEASHVHVFQRTPQWITPRERYGDPVSAEIRWLNENMPYYWNWTRYTEAIPVIDLYGYLLPDREWQAQGGFFNEQNDALRESLTNYISTQLQGRTDLIERLTPNYPPFARRMIVDNGWYRSLLRDNVELVTTPISQITANGIVTSDGKMRSLDMIISAVGFSVEKYVWPADYVGVGSVHLQDRWDEVGIRAYLGMMVYGFPNFFIMYGPNSQSVSGGGATLPPQVEMWSNYIAKIIVASIENGCAAADVRREAFEKYNERLDETANELIWLVDKSSLGRNYYVINGRLQVNVPWRYLDWHEMLSKPNFDDLAFSSRDGGEMRVGTATFP
jgi:4-hydroxyacetophenone monooxygenase